MARGMTRGGDCDAHHRRQHVNATAAILTMIVTLLLFTCGSIPLMVLSSATTCNNSIGSIGVLLSIGSGRVSVEAVNQRLNAVIQLAVEDINNATNYGVLLNYSNPFG
jgi:hypothetical protein